MAAMTNSDFKRRFYERVKRIRESCRMTQQEMADILRIGLSRYQKYETRSYLPHDLILPFCIATGFTPTFLFTGRAEQSLTATDPIIKRGHPTAA